MKYFSIFVLMILSMVVDSQPCAVIDTVLKIDFGTDEKIKGDFVLWTGKYRKVSSNCPNDGEYAISSYLSRCFGDNWLISGADHTSDVGGNMLIVNAPERPAGFIHFPVFNLVGGENYILEFHVANLLKGADGCVPTQPDLTFTIETREGLQIASFKTGRIATQYFLSWKKYQGTFNLPKAEKELFIRIDNNVPGGCGNDFALDDILLLHCIPLKAEKRPTLASIVPPVKSPAHRVIFEMNQPVTVAPPETKKESVIVIPPPVSDTVVIVKEPEVLVITEPVADALEKRENIVIDKYKTDAYELLIEIFDNNLVDGDSVSIYHNDELLISHVAITKEPYSFKIKIGPFLPHHEIVLVAENLGSTPPNTAVMVITANGKKRKIDVKSNKQKNAKVIVDWEK